MEDASNRMTSDDIRNLVSSSLASSDPRITDNHKRDTSSDQADDAASFDGLAEENVAAESKDNAMYDDEVDEDDGGQQLQQQLVDSEYKRSADASSASDLAERSIDQSDLATYDEPDVKVVKDVSKREAKSEDDYDEEVDVDPNLQEASLSADAKNIRSAPAESNLEPLKHETPREVSAEVESDLDYEKQIEDQIQQRIDSIKEDIKRELERKQRVREIEANNAKYDELEFNRGNEDTDGNEGANDRASGRRSVARDAAINGNSAGKVVGADSLSTRTKRSDLNNLSEVVKSEDDKAAPLVVPMKKRSFARRVTLVEKRDLGDAKMRQSRSASILIPERGHAEVKDELPGDLTLDPNLRLARSDEKIADNARSTRYRRDMSDEVENNKDEVNDEVDEASNFLFAAREKPDCRTRRRRSRSRKRMRSADRRKARKHPRHSKRHRTVRVNT